MKAFDVIRKILLTGALLAFGTGSMAQNTTPGNAVQYGSDQGWVTTQWGPTANVNTERWYRVELRSGRSYCMETALGDFADLSSDTLMFIYSGVVPTAGTQIASADDYATVGFTRGCFYYSGADNFDAFMNIRACCSDPPHISLAANTTFNPTRNIRFRLVDTTVTAPWWFVNNASGYNAFAEISNNHQTSVTITAKALGPTGAVLGTTTRLLSARGNIALSVASDFGVAIAAGSGSIEVGHTGPVGAINLNVTSLSATQGLSFDSPGTRRTNW